MRILVTGGAGFIGSHVVDRLVERGDEVVVLDSLAPDVHPSAPPWLHPEVRLVAGDVRDEAAWREALGDGVDAVCHQAARVGLGVDFSDAPRYVADNDLGTAVGLAVLHERRFAGRLVVASSMVVYGEGRARCDRHGVQPVPPRRADDLAAGRFDPACPTCGAALRWEPVRESDPVDPRNVYAATKLHQEHLATAFGREHGVAVTALRYHNVYGPRLPRDTPYAGVASLFRSAVERGAAPLVFEDGGQTRDFVHVDDVARANVAALTCTDPHDGPLNVASGRPATILDLAVALVDAMGRPDLVPQVTGDYRLGDVRHVVASPDLAAATIGFRAQVDLRQGLPTLLEAAERSVGPGR